MPTLNKSCSNITRFCKSRLPHYCPICEKFSFLFISFGTISRAAAQCPKCKSLERHRMLWLFIKKHFSSVIKNPNYNVLHIAAETCIKTKLNKLCAGKYLTGDLNSEIPLDITKLPLIDNFFSLIICSHVLEHVENDLLALKELYRVLKPRGRALIMVPTLGKITYENPMILCPKDREKIFGNSDHVRRYGRDFTEKLTRIGFNVHVYSTNELHGILARQLLSLRKELIFDCHK